MNMKYTSTTLLLLLACSPSLPEARTIRGKTTTSATGTPLPSFMIGDWKMETSTGFNNYLWELSVGWLSRSIATLLYPLDKISQTRDGLITYDTITSVWTASTQFKIGEPFRESTLDGRTTTTMARVDGNKLVKDQVPDASTGYLSTRQVREFKDTDGDGVVDTFFLTLTIISPGYNTVSTGVYRKVDRP